jgi:hypothetical protein
MRTTAMIGSGLIATPTAEGRKSPIAWPTAEDDNVRPRMGEADMADRLASWNDGETKAAIVDFVERVTTEGGPDFVPPAERIATFDNDGTLWCEKPMPIELGFILARLTETAEADESLREKQPWKAAHERDYHWLGDALTKHYQATTRT